MYTYRVYRSLVRTNVFTTLFDAQQLWLRLGGMLHVQDEWLTERERLRRRPCEDLGC
jgi:hypothetical protein